MIAALRGSSRNVPSLSSASTTNQSPLPHAAPPPISLTSPPMMNDGCHRASTRMSESIDDVVVLPCVPATAIVAALRADGGEHLGAAAHRDVASRALHDGRVVVSDRCAHRHGVDAVDLVRVVADLGGHAGRRDARQHGAVALIGSADGVAHRVEHDGDRRHTGAADADDVDALRSGEVDHRPARPAAASCRPDAQCSQRCRRRPCRRSSTCRRAETNGSGTPVTGSAPTTVAMFSARLAHEPRRDAAGNQCTKHIWRLTGGPDAADAERHEQADDAEPAERDRVLRR